MEYASNAKANAGMITGIIGTVGTGISLLNSMGILNGMGQKSEGDRPVTRYEMGLFQQMNAKDQEITLLKANQFTTAQIAGVQAQINAQAIYNAQATSTMGFIQQQVNDLRGITRLMVPNENLAPGYGRAFVAPVAVAPPPPPFFPVPPPPVVEQQQTTTTTTTQTGG